MFSKIDKKVLTVSVIILVLVFLIAIAFYNNLNKINAPQVENSVGGANTLAPAENQITQPEQQVQTAQPGIQVEIEGENGGGSLSVCEVKCGDGVCQKEGDGCDAGVCICAETAKDCPEDCK